MALECFKGAAQTLGRHYVERNYRTYIINAPSWFGLMWAVVSPFLSARTRKKVGYEEHLSSCEKGAVEDGNVVYSLHFFATSRALHGRPQAPSAVLVVV
jgi:CRAL/TRIO domain